MMKRSPNPVDVHVGSRVRLRRLMLEMSQEKLGAALGLTFQQVQKYEKGTNRIGASRLHHIAHILQVPVSFFFELAPGSNAFPERPVAALPPNCVHDFLLNSEGLALIKAFQRIADKNMRRSIVDFTEQIACPNDCPSKLG